MTIFRIDRRDPGLHNHRRYAGCAGLTAVLLTLLIAATLWGVADHSTTMKRRQQGILTGMPFMANLAPRTFVDDDGKKIYLAQPPARVISLAPSITEALFAIGAGGAVVGVTTWCDYPPEAVTRTQVGDARPNLETILSLQPDLVLAVDVIRDDVLEALRRLKIPVFVMKPHSLERVYAHIQTLGRMFQHVQEADSVVQTMRADIRAIGEQTRDAHRPRVLYVLYDRPLMTVGAGSFLHQLLELAGGDNVAKDAGAAWPQLSMEVVVRKDPEVLLFPSMDGQNDPDDLARWTRWTAMTAVKNRRLHFVPWTLVSRPGPRLAQGLAALAGAIHPEIFQEGGR